MPCDMDSVKDTLPTTAEIEAATDILSMPDNSAQVVRVREHFAVKFGNGIPLTEAENMRFIAANSRVPRPRSLFRFYRPRN